MKFTGEIGSCARPFSVFVSHSVTSRSGAANGNGRSTTASTAVKTVVAAPVPDAEHEHHDEREGRVLAELAEREAQGARDVEARCAPERMARAAWR